MRKAYKADSCKKFVCISLNNRTLKGGRHDIIYEFLENNDFCHKYVRNPQFCGYVKATLNKFRGKTVDELGPVEFYGMVKCIDRFIQIYNSWKTQLEQSSVTDFFTLMETNKLFPARTSDLQKRDVSYDQLCYHLGMIALDV